MHGAHDARPALHSDRDCSTVLAAPLQRRHSTVGDAGVDAPARRAAPELHAAQRRRWAVRARPGACVTPPHIATCPTPPPTSILLAGAHRYLTHAPFGHPLQSLCKHPWHVLSAAPVSQTCRTHTQCWCCHRHHQFRHQAINMHHFPPLSIDLLFKALARSTPSSDDHRVNIRFIFLLLFNAYISGVAHSFVSSSLLSYASFPVHCMSKLELCGVFMSAACTVSGELCRVSTTSALMAT